MPLDPEEGRGTGDRTQIVRVADTVENQQRFAVAAPLASLLRVELGQRPRPGDRDDAAMQHRAGDAREFRLVDLAIGLVGIGQDLAQGADARARAPGLEKEPLDAVGIAFE